MDLFTAAALRPSCPFTPPAGSAAMKARAALARRAYPSRVLTPLEAFRLLADEDNIRIVDVRTEVRLGLKTKQPG
eukprot:scaffold98_cov51-Isochrysis_galbana.AAC.1